MGEAGLVRDKIEGTQELIVEYGRVGDEGKMALLLGLSVKSLEREEGGGRESG